MKLCFIGSGVEEENINIGHIEIDSILDVLIKKYDTLIYGGSREGFMGKIAKGFKKRGGAIISIVPEWLNANGLVLEESDEIIKCKSIIDRKNIMFKMCDDIICYPGGLGTLDELFTYLACDANESIFKKCNIFIYNHQKYYSPLLLQIETAIECGFIKKSHDIRIKVFEYVDQLGEII